jgi:hypothetical protein
MTESIGNKVNLNDFRTTVGNIEFYFHFIAVDVTSDFCQINQQNYLPTTVAVF